MASADRQTLDLPSWYKGHPDAPLRNRWNVCKITVRGQTGSFFCRSVKAPVTHRLDVKMSRGKDGAKLTNTGIMPSRVTIVLEVWTGQAEQDWLAFAPSINPKLSPTGRVLAKVSHPILDEQKISNVWVYDVDPSLQDSGVKSIKIEAMEFFQSKIPVTTTAKKPTEIARPNAFDKPDVRATVADPSKDVKIK